MEVLRQSCDEILSREAPAGDAGGAWIKGALFALMAEVYCTALMDRAGMSCCSFDRPGCDTFDVIFFAFLFELEILIGLPTWFKIE